MYKPYLNPTSFPINTLSMVPKPIKDSRLYLTVLSCLLRLQPLSFLVFHDLETSEECWSGVYKCLSIWA